MRAHIRVTGLFLIAVCAAAVFIVAGKQLPADPRARAGGANNDIVLPPALLSMAYLGDAYLAANAEFVRITSSGRLADDTSIDFFARLHANVSRLNPCHEDNYYIASAFLSWGGATETTLSVLNQASRCRAWDPWPAFMLGFNQFFFVRDTAAAAESMREAARRASGKEATFFGTLAITLQAADFDDLGAALAYLRSEQSQTRDALLKEALARRVGRLEGLLALREAQQTFERKYGRPLRDPGDLLSSGLMAAYPKDPLGVGYEFRGGRFELRQAIKGPQRK